VTPATTALISSLVVYAVAAGMIPAKTVATARPVVSAGLASQTSRSTRGSAARVPDSAWRMLLSLLRISRDCSL
jgi:hypothetical protein